MKATTPEPQVVIRKATRLVRPADAELAALAKASNEAKRVTILGGAGCRRCARRTHRHREQAERANRAHAPRQGVRIR